MHRIGLTFLFLVVPCLLFAQQPAATPQQQAPPAASAPAPQNAFPVIVLDPGHGGEDAGARGPSGILEKDVVLTLAKAVRADLERQRLHVILTRQGNENPSFDERAALSNSYRHAIFISLHVSSSGTVGVARIYFSTSGAGSAPAPGALVRWEQAQEPFVLESRHLAEALAVQLARNFRGSPEVAAPVNMRQFRFVAAPAVAIEISSVAVTDRTALDRLAPALAQSISRALAAYSPAASLPASGSPSP
ncbi:MAG: N-acetylmuramoyl-L-alanine amidase [Acidobacteria bacterium]|nr:N-acetylmuramoyl-L-alanine amidase [Acidobacteriota bacterium]